MADFNWFQLLSRGRHSRLTICTDDGGKFGIRKYIVAARCPVLAQKEETAFDGGRIVISMRKEAVRKFVTYLNQQNWRIKSRKKLIHHQTNDGDTVECNDILQELMVLSQLNGLAVMYELYELQDQVAAEADWLIHKELFRIARPADIVEFVKILAFEHGAGGFIVQLMNIVQNEYDIPGADVRFE